MTTVTTTMPEKLETMGQLRSRQVLTKSLKHVHEIVTDTAVQIKVDDGASSFDALKIEGAAITTNVSALHVPSAFDIKVEGDTTYFEALKFDTVAPSGVSIPPNALATSIAIPASFPSDESNDKEYVLKTKKGLGGHAIWSPADEVDFSIPDGFQTNGAFKVATQLTVGDTLKFDSDPTSIQLKNDISGQYFDALQFNSSGGIGSITNGIATSIAIPAIIPGSETYVLKTNSTLGGQLVWAPEADSALPPVIEVTKVIAQSVETSLLTATAGFTISADAAALFEIIVPTKSSGADNDAVGGASDLLTSVKIPPQADTAAFDPGKKYVLKTDVTKNGQLYWDLDFGQDNLKEETVSKLSVGQLWAADKIITPGTISVGGSATFANLTVEGTLTYVNTENLLVKDHRLELGVPTTSNVPTLAFMNAGSISGYAFTIAESGAEVSSEELVFVTVKDELKYFILRTTAGSTNWLIANTLDAESNDEWPNDASGAQLLIWASSLFVSDANFDTATRTAQVEKLMRLSEITQNGNAIYKKDASGDDGVETSSDCNYWLVELTGDAVCDTKLLTSGLEFHEAVFSDESAIGAGIVIKGTSDKVFQYVRSSASTPAEEVGHIAVDAPTQLSAFQTNCDLVLDRKKQAFDASLASKLVSNPRSQALHLGPMQQDHWIICASWPKDMLPGMAADSGGVGECKLQFWWGTDVYDDLDMESQNDKDTHLAFEIAAPVVTA